MKQQTKGKLIQSDKVLELMEGVGVVMRIAAFAIAIIKKCVSMSAG